ncbi:hypothetical protein FAZ15_19885 [Sphingobacterium olei]|uniref:Uncharacterized protein n=1 Tax=Sphingobacterium olei TaxID=2571155 RepID=A0A4U0NCY4_9SPHI|nr:hypothetical protein [Sphingobacterium olei]TJZ51810.1 hypothetical protein FAZ15_19885 [Sphingobacterium olei]
MGFGFNLFFLFLLLPLSGILLVIWLISKRSIFGKALGLIWIGVAAMGLLSVTIQWLFAQKVLSKNDYYGTYVIDRDYFKGRQADWQYNSFRFEIRNNDSIYFYVADKDKIINTVKGTIQTVKPYESHRLMINMEQPGHHILATDPTTYRNAWNFFLVFNSKKFKNMYFKKGKWKKLE